MCSSIPLTSETISLGEAAPTRAFQMISTSDYEQEPLSPITPASNSSISRSQHLKNWSKRFSARLSNRLSTSLSTLSIADLKNALPSRDSCKLPSRPNFRLSNRLSNIFSRKSVSSVKDLMEEEIEDLDDEVIVEYVEETDDDDSGMPKCMSWQKQFLSQTTLDLQQHLKDSFLSGEVSRNHGSSSAMGPHPLSSRVTSSTSSNIPPKSTSTSSTVKPQNQQKKKNGNSSIISLGSITKLFSKLKTIKRKKKKR